jgi:CHAT domain-containing protein/tetratricopeptide (TPR) repeat protein
MYLGRYDRALELAAQTRHTLETLNEPALLAQLETNVGNIHHRLDQYQQALACYEHARRVFTSIGDPKAAVIVGINCGNVYSCLNDFRGAETAYQQAYEISREQRMELFAAQAKYSLGYLHFLTGEYHHAMRVLHEVQEEFVRLGDERHTALCQLDLAEIYLQLNVLDEAATQATAARARFLALHIRYEAAKTLMWLGLAQLRQSKLSEAENSLTQAGDEFTQEGNEICFGLTRLYLAELYLRREQTAEARALATQAAEIFARDGLQIKTGCARLVMARALGLDGATGEARQICKEILAACGELSVPWLRHQVHELLGDLLLDENSEPQAYQHYLQAVSFIEQMRGNIRVDEFRSAFFRDKLRVYEKLIRLCLKHETPDKQAEAFFYLESRKARTLVDLVINELEIVPTGQTSSAGALLSRWQQLREELHWFYSRISQFEAEGKSRRLGVDQQLQHEISSRERALSEVVRQAQILDSDFAWMQNPSGMTINELRAILKPDETVIEYYFDGDDLKIFVIDHAQFRVIDSRGRRTELKELILELRFQLDKFRYGQQYIDAHLDSLRQSTNECLRELHQLLFAPIAERVTGQKLIFIPFDLLHNVPFQALYDGESYLLDRHETAYAPSARLLALCARKPQLSGERALIFGAADEIAPQINEEINAIRRLFPSARCFTAEAADSHALLKHLPASDIVHIASHAVFRQDNPMFSAFRLADTWLNFFDVSALSVPSSLITLSGCSTGANRIYAGDEILGLVRGFLSAGAAALVVSLWAVNDPATARLMTLFYEHLQQGLAPRPALRRAELEIREAFNHPYYWAPFIFIGHNRSGFPHHK